MANWITGGFGLYLHWPYCQSKCPYCDFNSHVMGVVDQNLWREAYLAEIARYAEETAGNLLQTIYFGGGTPSLLPPAAIAALLAAVDRHFGLAADGTMAQISPDTTETLLRSKQREILLPLSVMSYARVKKAQRNVIEAT